MSWLRDVGPDPSRPAPEPASDPDLVEAVRSAIGESAVAWAAQVGADAEAVIVERFGIFRDEPDLRVGPESATLSALLKFFDSASTLPALPADAARAIRHYIVSGVTLDQLLGGIRIGHATMSNAFLEACDRLSPPEDRAATLRTTSALLFDYIESFAQAAAVRYESDRVDLLADPSMARLRVVRRLLKPATGDAPGDEGDDVDEAQVARDLGYTLSQTHLAIVIEDEPNTRIDLRKLAYGLARQLFAQEYLVVAADRQVWAWFAGVSARGGPVQDRIEVPGGVQISIGSPAADVAGFRASHAQAQQVHHLRSKAAFAPPVWTHDEAEMILLLADDLERARGFVRRQLLGLSGRSPMETEIRATLLGYLDAHASPIAAARTLHLARNTVSARVQRASELLGRDLTGPTLDLHLALRLASILGDAVLPAPARTV